MIPKMTKIDFRLFEKLGQKIILQQNAQAFENASKLTYSLIRRDEMGNLATIYKSKLRCGKYHALCVAS